MKVGLLTTSYPRFPGDHAGHFVEGFAQTLANRAHQVSVIAPGAPHIDVAPHVLDVASAAPYADVAVNVAPAAPYAESTDEFEERRANVRARQESAIDVRRVPYWWPPNRQRSFYADGAPVNLRSHRTWPGAAIYCSLSYRVARAVDRQVDAWLSHWAVPSGWTVASIARGKPHLCVMHETDIRWLERNAFGKRIAATILRKSSALWFLSTELQERFFTLATAAPQLVRSCRVDAQIHVGPMGVHETTPPGTTDVHETTPPGTTGVRETTPPAAMGIRGAAARSTDNRRVDDADPQLLFLGRLIEVKGVDLLLRAMARTPNAPHLHIAGDGPERDKLTRTARLLGVSCTFHGHIGEAQKRALFERATALVVPSVRCRGGEQDGIPTVVLEAMGHGVPVVATHTSNLPSLIQHGENGWLCAPTTSALATSIERLGKDAALRSRLSDAGHRTAARHHWSALGPLIERLLTC